jgi:hypothetical protein
LRESLRGKGGRIDILGLERNEEKVEKSLKVALRRESAEAEDKKVTVEFPENLTGGF